MSKNTLQFLLQNSISTGHIGHTDKSKYIVSLTLAPKAKRGLIVMLRDMTFMANSYLAWLRWLTPFVEIKLFNNLFLAYTLPRRDKPASKCYNIGRTSPDSSCPSLCVISRSDSLISSLISFFYCVCIESVNYHICSSSISVISYWLDMGLSGYGAVILGRNHDYLRFLLLKMSLHNIANHILQLI